MLSSDPSRRVTCSIGNGGGGDDRDGGGGGGDGDDEIAEQLRKTAENVGSSRGQGSGLDQSGIEVEAVAAVPALPGAALAVLAAVVIAVSLRRRAWVLHDGASTGPARSWRRALGLRPQDVERRTGPHPAPSEGGQFPDRHVRRG